jgi:hypothetical protein
MSLKEFVAHEVETLGENELQAVAEYVSFLKFRSRTSLGDARLASLYGEFEQEDRELAETGMADYARVLSQEDAQ